MKILKNLFFGFLVSFLGSLPLGYLNIAGVAISKLGVLSLLWYLLGVVSVEAIVLYATIVFANLLSNNKKLMRVIDIFAVFFLLGLACLFHFSTHTVASQSSFIDNYINYSTFTIGVVLCGFNFLQIPFWLGWNLYLLNANQIILLSYYKFYYILGVVTGTFLGMFLIIKALHLLHSQYFSLSNAIIPVILPLFFIGLAVFQIIKVYRKYYKTS